MVSLSPVGGVRQAGRLFALFLDVFRLIFRRPFQFREFIQQAWFVASVTIVPTALVAIPFGAVIALQLGSLARQIGAQSFIGAASVLAIVREASPIVCRAADRRRRRLGDLRRPRQPQDPRRDRRDGGAGHLADAAPGGAARSRLHARRGRANGLVCVVGTAGGYFFNVVLQGGTPGAYLASFSALAQLPDLYAGELKAFIFGIIAGGRRVLQGTERRRRPEGRRRRGEPVRRHHVPAAVLRQLRHHGRVLPGRPGEGVVMANRPGRLGPQGRQRAGQAARRPRRADGFLRQGAGLDAANGPPLQEGGAAAALGGGLRQRLARRHRRHRRRHRVHVLLHRHRGRPAGLRLAGPARHRRRTPASSPRSSTPARSRRSSPAWRCRRPSAAASPPSSAPCGSARRSTRSRSWRSPACRSS